MKEYTYSIIIPHRNSLNLLKRAVVSIPNRDDIQIIIIDNSSENYDFSEILSVNNNIEIYYSDSSRGAGGARNVGLEKANGKWAVFLDADDYFEHGAFNFFDFYDAKGYEYEVIFFKWSSRYSDTLEIANRDLHYNRFIDAYLNNKRKKDELILRYLLDTPCGKMVSMDLIKQNNIIFDECKACNDAFFSTKTGHYAKQITASKEIVYCATVQKGSITNVRSAENLESRLLANLRIYRFLRQNKIKVIRPILKLVLQAFHFGPRVLIKCISYMIKYSYNPLPEISEVFRINNIFKKKIRIKESYKNKC